MPSEPQVSRVAGGLCAVGAPGLPGAGGLCAVGAPGLPGCRWTLCRQSRQGALALYLVELSLLPVLHICLSSESLPFVMFMFLVITFFLSFA